MFSGRSGCSEAEAALTQAFTFANSTTMIITNKTNRLLLVPMGAMMLTEDDKDGADGEFMALMRRVHLGVMVLWTNDGAFSRLIWLLEKTFGVRTFGVRFTEQMSFVCGLSMCGVVLISSAFRLSTVASHCCNIVPLECALVTHYSLYCSFRLPMCTRVCARVFDLALKRVIDMPARLHIQLVLHLNFG